MNKNNLQVELTAEEVQNLAGKPIPAPKELFKPLSNWHSVLYDAFYYALPRTRDMLKQTHCKQSIKWFKPQIIRFLVNDFLFDKEISAQLVDDNDEKQNDANYEPRVSNGNGIAGNINGYEYRILKMNKGTLPQPLTPIRKEYYNNQKQLESYQASFPQMSFDNLVKHQFKPNLVYLWKLDRNKIELYLAIPTRPYLYNKTELKLIPSPLTLLKQKETEGENKTNDVEEVNSTHDLWRTNKTGTGV